MMIYVCSNCKKILTTVFYTSTQSFKKTCIETLPPIGYAHAYNNDKYLTSALNEPHNEWSCPTCNEGEVSEIKLTKENFETVFKLIKEDKEHKDHCELCGLYLRDPEACIWCSFDETEQVGGTSGN